MNSALYKVRSADFSDAGTIFKLLRDNSAEVLSRPVSDIVQNIDRFIVAEVNGCFAGTVSWQILPEIGLAKDPYVEIKSLAVEESSRGKGIGTALAREAIDRIMLVHPAHIVVLTFTPPFFEKLGFKEVSKEALMHKLYAGCINCTKYDSPFTCPEVAMKLEVEE